VDFLEDTTDGLQQDSINVYWTLWDTTDWLDRYVLDFKGDKTDGL